MAGDRAGAGCASRGGYAEPGPISANANPPGPASVANGGAPGPSLDPGASNEIPPAITATGNPVTAPDPGHAGQPTAAESCRTDTDCIPAGCCHPMTCAARAHAPVCAGLACTQGCAPGTLDCNQGHCACLGGACGVQHSR